MLEEGSFLIIMLLLSTALGLSFLIERFLEIVNGLFKRYIFSDLDALQTEEEQKVEVVDMAGDEEMANDDEKKHAPILLAVKPLASRNAIETSQAFLLQILGVVAGIVVCLLTDFRLFSPLGVFDGVSEPIDKVLTGLLIGGGSQPIHFLLEFLNQRKITLDAPSNGILPIANASGVIVDPVDCEPPSFFKILNVPYEGGYKPESLEDRNFRPAAPDLIVFHHTALHSNAAFEDVVREIVEVKGWSTGYHAVVTSNGAINNFCRWDRTGVHALGANHRSLGIALQGNFHAEPGDPFSNHDGRFGNLRPTDIQLLSAAKVVALWCHLFDLPVKFGETIVAHREVRATACAGSDFPYATFEELVKNCHESWKSHEAQAELIFYKQKQLIYST